MSSTIHCDVAVIGAGVAGLSACLLLRRRGHRVVCLDPQPYPQAKVGESLDWSSPGLLRSLGIDGVDLIAGGIATYKRRIVVSELDREPWTATPPPAIKRQPLRFETVTLHVDRAALDAKLYGLARDAGTEFVWKRVTRVDHRDGRVTGCATAGGSRVEARWYLDASGTARVFSRAMRIAVTLYGEPKVCVWTYFDTPALCEGTVFFVDNRDRYLRWVWDIPITPTRTSVGLILPAGEARDRRRAGESVDAILRTELGRHSRFAPLLAGQPALAIESTSFQPYVAGQVCGANWLLIGEAAAMPDPLTGNGLTSGIRHARHALDTIAAAGDGDAIPVPWRRRYSRHVFRLGRSFNTHIENAIYRHELRWGLGFQAATYVYTIFAFFMNALHARFDPKGRFGMAVFGPLFGLARVWVSGWTRIAKAVLWWRGRVRPAAAR